MATHYTKSITGTLTTYTVSTWVKKARLGNLELRVMIQWLVNYIIVVLPMIGDQVVY